jgi:adenine-specific DNA glycosylase
MTNVAAPVCTALYAPKPEACPMSNQINAGVQQKNIGCLPQAVPAAVLIRMHVAQLCIIERTHDGVQVLMWNAIHVIMKHKKIRPWYLAYCADIIRENGFVCPL